MTLPTCECGHAFRGHLDPLRGLLRCTVCPCDLYLDPEAARLVEPAREPTIELSWKERRAGRRQEQLDDYAAEVQEAGLR